MNYRCNLCPNFFSYDSKKLGLHMKKVHERKKNQCKICNKSFSTNYALKRHGESHEKIRENKITARRTFKLSPSNWRTPYAGISKESVAIQRINRTSSPGRRFSPGTPSRRKMEGEKLKSKKM